jgi:hypothetical protein
MQRWGEGWTGERATRRVDVDYGSTSRRRCSGGRSGGSRGGGTTA